MGVPTGKNESYEYQNTAFPIASNFVQLCSVYERHNQLVSPVRLAFYGTAQLQHRKQRHHTTMSAEGCCQNGLENLITLKQI